MHCKHCGSQIHNDSKYCSYCGGQVEAPVDTNLIQSDQGLVIAFCMMVGIRLFWLVYDYFSKDVAYYEKLVSFKFIIKPSYVIFWSIPLVLAVFVGRRSLRPLLMFVGFCMLFLSVYDNFIKGN